MKPLVEERNMRPPDVRKGEHRKASLLICVRLFIARCLHDAGQLFDYCLMHRSRRVLGLFCFLLVASRLLWSS